MIFPKESHTKPLPDVACHLKKYHNQMNKSRGSHIRHKTDAGIISKLVERNIIILDFDKEAILTISSPGIRESIELIIQSVMSLHIQEVTSMHTSEGKWSKLQF